MIDRDVFSVEIAILADKAGRELKAPTIAALYDVLADELTTEEFVIGCRRALRRESFFPTAQAIIALARPAEPSPEAKAGELFDRIRDCAYGWNRDALARYAVQQAGGEAMVMADDVRVASFARRDFVKAHAEAVRREADAAEIAALLPAARRVIAQSRRSELRPVADTVRHLMAGNGQTVDR